MSADKYIIRSIGEQEYISYDNGGSWSFYNKELLLTSNSTVIECECGQSSVNNLEDRKPEFHSIWCPIYEEKK